jgi:flagellar FliL protein
MADDDIEAPSKGGGKLKFIIIGVVALLVLGGGAVGGYMFFMADDDAAIEETATDENADGEGTEAEVTEPDAELSEAEMLLEAVYVPMPRPFIFNVPGQRRERLVQISVELMVRGVENDGIARTHIPLIEGTLLSVFSATTAEELSSAEGKRTVKFEATKAVRNALFDVSGKAVVEKVLFTGFVMQ